MAKYHYKLAEALLSEHLDRPNRIHPFILEFSDPDVGQVYRGDRKAAYANVSACLQNVHALADTFAHAIYYVLDLSSVIDRGSVSAYTVLREVRKDAKFKDVELSLALLWEHTGFNYIAALVNHSKHRSLLSPDLIHEFSDAAERRWKLEMREFTGNRNKEHFARCDLLPFLRVEVMRQSTLIREIGFQLDTIAECIEFKP